MKTPVLIAACNEAPYIGQTLDRLDAASVEPMVVANGSEDATAEIARSYLPDSHVIELADMGKLPAVQYGLKRLGERALEPVLLLDADSYPVSTARWERSMRRSVAGEQPAAAAGLTGFHGDISNGVIRSGRRFQQAIEARKTGNFTGTYGANMVLRLANRTMLECVLSMEHTWPGEDRYLASVVREQGEFTQVISPASLVLTSSRWLPSLRQRLQVGQKAAGDIVKDDYANRRAPGVTHYFHDGRLYSYDGTPKT